MAKWQHKKDSHHNGRKEHRENFIEGKLSVSAGGMGFVTPRDGTQDVFIPPRFLSSAIDGDIVKVGLLDEQRPNMKGPAGRVSEIMERSRTTVVGELIAGRKVRPLSKKLQGDITVNGSLQNAKKGDWVEIKLVSNEDSHSREHRGTLTSTIGKAGTVEFDIAAVIKETT